MAIADNEANLMARGMTKVAFHHYDHRDWPYSNLGDALPQARHDNASGTPEAEHT